MVGGSPSTQAEVLKEGTDVTLVGWANQVRGRLDANNQPKQSEKISLDMDKEGLIWEMTTMTTQQVMPRSGMVNTKRCKERQFHSPWV